MPAQAQSQCQPPYRTAERSKAVARQLQINSIHCSFNCLEVSRLTQESIDLRPESRCRCVQIPALKFFAYDIAPIRNADPRIILFTSLPLCVITSSSPK